MNDGMYDPDPEQQDPQRRCKHRVHQIKRHRIFCKLPKRKNLLTFSKRHYHKHDNGTTGHQSQRKGNAAMLDLKEIDKNA